MYIIFWVAWSRSWCKTIMLILSSLFDNLRNALDKTLVCKNRTQLKLVKKSLKTWRIIIEWMEIRAEYRYVWFIFSADLLSHCVPFHWKQWTEKNIIRGFSTYWQFPELIRYRIFLISFHKNMQISCIKTKEPYF